MNEQLEDIIYIANYDNLPFKCPVHQCGGTMRAVARDYPKGMSEKDFPDGMAGDFQTPDLICTKCKSIYRYLEDKLK